MLDFLMMQDSNAFSSLSNLILRKFEVQRRILDCVIIQSEQRGVVTLFPILPTADYRADAQENYKCPHGIMHMSKLSRSYQVTIN